MERWEVIKYQLNLVLRGWVNCFACGSPLVTFRLVDIHVADRVRNLLSRRRMLPTATGRFNYAEVHGCPVKSRILCNRLRGSTSLYSRGLGLLLLQEGHVQVATVAPGAGDFEGDGGDEASSAGSFWEGADKPERYRASTPPLPTPERGAGR